MISHSTIHFPVLLWAMGLGAIAGPAATAQDETADEALVLHYRFDQDPGELVQDLSSHGNDGRVVQAQYLEDVGGRKGVLRFGGAESHIDCGNSESLRLDGDMTLEMWVRLNAPLPSAGTYVFGDAAGHVFFLSASRTKPWM